MDTPLRFEPVGHSEEGCPRCGLGYNGVWVTVREREVLALVAQGMSNKMIGAALDIAGTTVKNHISSLIKKTGRRDRTGAVMTGLERGWIRKMSCKSFDVTHISSSHKLHDLKGRRLIVPHPVRNSEEVVPSREFLYDDEYAYTEGPYNQRTKHDA